MKNLLFIFLLCSTGLFGQTSTDSISTSLGEFVLVSTDTIEPSTGYYDETSTTADGGTAQYLEINSSGARYAQPSTDAGMSVEMLPNPTADIVELNFSGVSGAVNITVTDLVGQTIYSSVIGVDGTRVAYLPAQLWANGTYIVTVKSGATTHAERLVVQ